MFDAPFQIFDFSFIKIFGALIAIVFLIYRFQVIKLFFDEFSNWRSRKSKHEADIQKFSLLPDELDKIISENNKQYSPETTVKFHLQKIVHTNSKYLVHLTADDDSITIKNIFSKDFELFSSGPEQLLKNSLNFYFRFSLVNPDKETARFLILYEDKFAVKHSKEYILFIAESVLEELK